MLILSFIILIPSLVIRRARKFHTMHIITVYIGYNPHNMAYDVARTIHIENSKNKRKTPEGRAVEQRQNNSKTILTKPRGGQLVSTRALLLDLFLSCGFRSIIPWLEPPTILAQPLSGKDSKKKKKPRQIHPKRMMRYPVSRFTVGEEGVQNVGANNAAFHHY